MTAREWKPGDVAMVTAYNRPEPYRAYFDGKTWREHGADMFCVDSPSTIRPLVVIDLPQGALAGWPVLISAFREADQKTGYHMVFGGLIEQVEAQTAPPRPDEPKNYLAVVEVNGGTRFWRWSAGDAHTSCPWRLLGAVHADTEDDSGNWRWDDLAVTEVVSLGVEVPA